MTTTAQRLTSTFKHYPVQLAASSSQFETEAEVKQHYEELRRRAQMAERVADNERKQRQDNFWREVVQSLPTESAIRREKREEAEAAKVKQEEETLRVRQALIDKQYKDKQRGFQKKNRAQKAQNVRLALAQTMARLAETEAQIKQAEEARITRVARKVVTNIREEGRKTILGEAIAGWKQAKDSAKVTTPAKKTRRSRRKKVTKDLTTEEKTALDKADNAMAALLLEEEEANKPKLSKKQKKALRDAEVDDERLAVEERLWLATQAVEERLCREKKQEEEKLALQRQEDEERNRIHRESMAREKRMSETEDRRAEGGGRMLRGGQMCQSRGRGKQFGSAFICVDRSRREDRVSMGMSVAVLTISVNSQLRGVATPTVRG